MTREEMVRHFKNIRCAQGYVEAIRADMRQVDETGEPYYSWADREMASDEIAFQIMTIRDARAALASA